MNTLATQIIENALAGIEAHADDTIICMDCEQPAEYIGTGHRHYDCPGIQPPPPWFKCVTCYCRWLDRIAATLADYTAVQCTHCDRIFTDLDEFSYWRPV